MACPEVYPSAGLPLMEMDVNMLKRLMLSGPSVGVSVMNCVMGAICPRALRTLMLLSDSMLARALNSACTMTR